MEFGEFLRMKRKEKRMSIRQLALYAGCSDSYLSQLERGAKGNRGPTPGFLRKLASPLGIPYEVLMAAAGYQLLTEKDVLYTGALIQWLRESLGDNREQFADRLGMSVLEIETLEEKGISIETLQVVFEKIFGPQRLLTQEKKALLWHLEDVFRQLPTETFLKVEKLFEDVIDIVFEVRE